VQIHIRLTGVCSNYCMSCAVCESNNQVEYPVEMAMHFHGPEDLKRPHILIFPNVRVCLDCGFSRFATPQAELRLLREGINASQAA
jgi:hypothetical protein